MNKKQKCYIKDGNPFIQYIYNDTNFQIIEKVKILSCIYCKNEKPENDLMFKKTSICSICRRMQNPFND